MAISFKVNHFITTEQFTGLLESSTLGERRPIHDRDCSAYNKSSRSDAESSAAS